MECHRWVFITVQLDGCVRLLDGNSTASSPVIHLFPDNTVPRTPKKIELMGFFRRFVENPILAACNTTQSRMVGTVLIVIFGGIDIWLVVSTPLKNISQNGNLPQIGVKIKNI